MEREVIQVDLTLANIGIDRKLFFMMLSQFEPMALIKEIKNITEAFELSDNWDYYASNHSLRCGAGYIGALRLRDACWMIEQLHHAGNFQEMYFHYPLVIEEAIAVRVAWRKLVAIENNEECEILPEHESIDHSQRFRLKKDHRTGVVYCLRHG